MKKFSPTTTNDPLTRRMFLRRSVTMGAGIVGIVSIPAQALTTDSESTDPTVNNDGYHLTEHIAEYYKSAEV